MSKQPRPRKAIVAARLTPRQVQFLAELADIKQTSVSAVIRDILDDRIDWDCNQKRRYLLSQLTDPDKVTSDFDTCACHPVVAMKYNITQADMPPGLTLVIDPKFLEDDGVISKWLWCFNSKDLEPYCIFDEQKCREFSREHPDEVQCQVHGQVSK